MLIVTSLSLCLSFLFSVSVIPHTLPHTVPIIPFKTKLYLEVLGLAEKGSFIMCKGESGWIFPSMPHTYVDNSGFLFPVFS